MTRNQNLAAVALLILAASAMGVWLLVRGSDASPPVSAASPAPVVGARPEAASSPATPMASPSKPRVRRLVDPSARAEILRQVRAAGARRTTPTAPASAPTPAPALPAPTLEKEYIRASVRELIPLIAECYEQGLERDPKLEGSVVVDFTIEGEPGVGGVIGESAIDAADSTLMDPEVRECIQETMFGIEIEPPAGGGVVRVRYPFLFRAVAEE